ncbi:MAG: SoxR reducing system RseC family protein [Gammaproteobacteria bacterium]|nr:SoxR reducing system RseC family protein [Gammaproteobacteria bacterium]
MIEELAIVKRIEGDRAVIEVMRQNACQSCELSGGCGTGSLGKLLGQRKVSFTMRNEHGLKIGDRVVIGLPDRSYLTAGFIVYLLPLLSLFLFAGLTDFLFGSIEWVNVLSAVVGLGLGLLWAARLANHNYARDFQPHFIRHSLSFD